MVTSDPAGNSTPPRQKESGKTEDESTGSSYYSTRKIRRSLKHFLIGRGVSSLASLLVALLIVRELDVSDYAGYTAISGLLMSLVLAANLGLDRVITRYSPVLRQAGAELELRRFFWSLIGLRAAANVAFLIPVWWASRAVGDHFSLDAFPGLVPAFAVYLMGFTLSKQIGVSLQALLLNKEATTGVAIEWVGKLLVFLFLLSVAGGFGLAEAVWVQGVTALAGASYMTWKLASQLKAVDSRLGVGRMLDGGTVLRMATQNYLSSLSGYHTTPAAAKLIGAAILSESATAALGFAYAIVGFLQRYLPANLLVGLIEPVVMARYSERGDFDEAAKLTHIILKFNLFVLLPLAVWLGLAGRPLIEFLTGGRYGDSTWLIAALTIVFMLQSQGLILQMMCNAVERSELLVKGNLWSALLVPFVIASTFLFGAAGLVAGVALVSVTYQAYILRRLRRIGFDYRLPIGGILRILVFSAVAAPVGVAMAEWLTAGMATMILGPCFTLWVFLVLAYVFKPFTQWERARLNSLVGRKLFVW